jgi:outer membrane protein TolC
LRHPHNLDCRIFDQSSRMKSIVTILLSLLAAQLSAQAIFHNLNEYLTYVSTHNPGLESEAFNKEISESRVRAAWSSLVPQVRAFGNFDNNINLPVQLVPAQIFGGPEGTFREIKFGTRYNASYGAEASLSLVNVSNWKNVDAANLASKASEAQYEDKKLVTLETAATTYYFVLLSNEAVQISKELLTAADTLLAAAEVRLANGMIEPLEFNRVKSLHIDTRQQYLAFIAAREKKLNQLKTLAGFDLNDSLQITESLSQLETNSNATSLTATTSSLPAYQMLTYRSMQAHHELKRQQAKVLPEISLYARYSKQSFSNDPNIFGNDNTWYDITVAGLRAEWSIFTGFNRQSQIRQASLRLKQSQLELQSYLLKSDSELEELMINHRHAAERLQAFREQYQVTTESYKIAGIKYHEGVYTIDQYVTIYQDLVRSQNQHLNALADFLMYESIIQSRNKFQ